MNNILLVAMGGAVGSVLRFILQRLNVGSSFPYGTLAVNLFGCLLIGIIWGLISRNFLRDSTQLLLISGFCGGFTTFSAFSIEAMQMLQQNKWILFSGYIIVSVIGGLLITIAGYKITS